ncbi:hypothetical protein MNBD_GAMMA12-2795 [hydrothermal vent metagenome]|uniref:Fatty acid hydroxylase domain-containing protein n=1 Tax=hydrothermal vent metagenome TaxID=652676 RepID=A0A3B0YGS2_9ZZZZ
MINNKKTAFFSSKLNYWLELVFDIVFLAALLAYTIITFEFTMYEILGSILVGVVIWTLLEYFFHYWMFHASPFRAFRRGHAKHHVDPKGFDALPFFLPAMIFSAIAYGLYLVMPVHLALLITNVIVAGYFYYGLIHVAIHHVERDNIFLDRLKAYHELHHQVPSKYFGVTTSFWDIIFRTR